MGIEIKTIYQIELWLRERINHIRTNSTCVSDTDIIADLKENVIKKNQDYFFTNHIDGAGFYFVNPWSDNSVFFDRKDNAKEQTYNTPYKIESNNLTQEDLHLLFLFVRETQRNTNKKRTHETALKTEFFRWMPLNDSTDSYFSNEEVKIRTETGVHYCTLGEVLFTTLIWRKLHEFNPILQWGKFSYHRCEEKGKIRFKDITLLDTLKEANWSSVTGQKFNESFKENEELKRLRIFNSDNDIDNFYFEAILIFLEKSQLLSTQKKEQLMLLKESDEVIQTLTSFANNFYTFLNGNKPANLVSKKDEITFIESNARFPILPFYVWNVADKFPHTYITWPVWYSVNNFYDVEQFDKKRSINYAGFSLTAISPMYSDNGYGDWSLPDKTKYINHPFVKQQTTNNASIIDIKLILNKLSEPLIEIAYYDNYRREMVKAKEKEIIAGIMARNLSHNFGSHILGNKSLYDNLKLGSDEYKNQRSNLKKFHHYLQSRLDFISRIISNAPAQYETIFFFTDLLDKFTFQEAVLNTIASDSGYNSNNFHLNLTLNTKEYTFNRAINYFQDSKGKLPEDFLIAIPGGMTGAHAFYSIIENLIRNAVKYGKKKDSFELTIEIIKPVKSLEIEVSIYENLSNHKIAEEINNKLQRQLINPNGKIQMDYSHSGLIEIKKCAEFLNKKTCDAIKCVNKKGKLVYQLPLYRPVIIGNYSIGETLPHNFEFKEITRFSSLKNFAEYGCYFAVLYELDSAPINNKVRLDIIKSIEITHHRLPYRILLFAKNIQSLEIWKSLISKSLIPKKRVKLINNSPFINDFLLNKGRKYIDVVLELYKIWMEKYKPLPENRKYNLLIGFEKNISVFENLIHNKEFDIVDILVTNKEGKLYYTNKSLISLKDGNDLEHNLPLTLVFDNHGNIFSELTKGEKLSKQSFMFYHKIEVKNNELCQELSNPPVNEKLFEFFIYTLLEASLTKVLIIDERVVSAYLSEKTNNDYSNEIESAGVYLANAINGQSIYKSNINKNLIIKKEVKWVSNEQSISQFDAIILHHGKYEELSKDGNLEYGQLKRLYKMSPVFIWTSGRGYDLKRTSDTLDAQFIDFSELNYTTFLSFNKFDLGKAVLSKYGTNEKI